MPHDDYALAIDVGGTKIAAAIVNRQGAVIRRLVRATRADLGAPAILQTIKDVARELLRIAGHFALPVAAVGVGSAGQVNVDLGAISYASDNLPGWTGLPLAYNLEDALQLPVVVDNDVNALAVGEHHFGGGRGTREALYVAVGTGLGGAVVRDGVVWRGSTWSAGEVCHLVVDITGARRCSCGAYGHLEAYTSGPAMTQRYQDLSGDGAPDLRAVTLLARQGDAHAIRAIAEGAQILGKSLAGVLNVLDPELLVIGGGVPQIGPLWWTHFESALRDNPMPGPSRIAVRPAELGVDAVLIGAAWLAMSKVR